MVSVGVVFVFRSSRRENRELSNQGKVEGTALMWNGQRYEAKCQTAGNTSNGHTSWWIGTATCS